MQHSDFKIGGHFYSGRSDGRLRKWRCTDVGTRVVVAIRVDSAVIHEYDFAAKKNAPRIVSEAEAERLGWFNGPPYAGVEYIFDEDDFEGCALSPDEL
jgi:hypothetical protein